MKQEEKKERKHESLKKSFDSNAYDINFLNISFDGRIGDTRSTVSITKRLAQYMVASNVMNGIDYMQF